MFKETYNVIGVMSGTSLDGIDLAHINFTIFDGKWTYQILKSDTISYPIDWLNKLKVAVGFSKEELTQLNNNYTQLLGETIKLFINNNQIIKFVLLYYEY
jgi:anhydro-N-acetylmuramic acid kinase